MSIDSRFNFVNVLIIHFMNGLLNHWRRESNEGNTATSNTRLLGPGQTSIVTRNEHITNAKWAQTIVGILLISICIYEYIIPSRASGAEKTAYRVFSLTWPASMQIYWNKRKRLHKKGTQLPKDWFGTPTWPPFYCCGTPIWPPWRHVKTLYRIDHSRKYHNIP